MKIHKAKIRINIKEKKKVYSQIVRHINISQNILSSTEKKRIGASSMVSLII